MGFNRKIGAYEYTLDRRCEVAPVVTVDIFENPNELRQHHGIHIAGAFGAALFFYEMNRLLCLNRIIGDQKPDEDIGVEPDHSPDRR